MNGSQEYRPGIPSRPNIYVLCMHKAASTFVADVLLPSIAIRTAEYDLYNLGSKAILLKQKLLAEYGADSPQMKSFYAKAIAANLAENPLPQSNQLIGRIYPNDLAELIETLKFTLPNPDCRVIALRRDPRDALIYLYYSKAISHDTSGVLRDSNRFQSEREELRERSVREGIRWLISQPSRTLLSEFMTITELILDNNQVSDLPYELLMNEPRQWLNQFIAAGDLHRYVDDAWYDEMESHLQPPAVENPSLHKRRMRPGNWVDVFDDELRQMVDDEIGIRMKIFGYRWDAQPAKTQARRAA